jgi:hypothetical protein
LRSGFESTNTKTGLDKKPHYKDTLVSEKIQLDFLVGGIAGNDLYAAFEC